MGRLLTTEEFITKARVVHGNTYSYKKTEYSLSKNKVLITCRQHGDFYQQAGVHLGGAGCRLCGNIVSGKVHELTTESFKQKAVLKHGSNYTYDAVVYKKYDDVVTITCPVHGDFEQKAYIHLSGSGCSACADSALSRERTKTREQFLAEALAVHGNKYTYNIADYVGQECKVAVICSKHGEFRQTAHSHLAGSGCPKCGFMRSRAAAQAAPTGWSHSSWDKAGKKSQNFEGFSVYIIECNGFGETFLKIGKTFAGLSKRFSSTESMPYAYVPITQVYHNAFAISKLEGRLHKACKRMAYTPLVSFSGMHECFKLTEEELAEVLDSVKRYSTEWDTTGEYKHKEVIDDKGTKEEIKPKQEELAECGSDEQPTEG